MYACVCLYVRLCVDGDSNSALDGRPEQDQTRRELSFGLGVLEVARAEQCHSGLPKALDYRGYLETMWKSNYDFKYWMGLNTYQHHYLRSI